MAIHALVGMLLLAGSARADVPQPTLKQLLAVQDPALVTRTASGRPLSLAANDQPSDASPTAADDDETPAALSGEPAAPEAAEAEVKKPAVMVNDEESSAFKTWWFWALAAAVVGGTVALGVWAAQPEDQPAGLCSPNVIACFGDGR